MAHRSERVATALIRVRAGARHGVVFRQQVLAAGLTDDDIHALLRRGRWVALQRGIYAVGAPSPMAQAIAAVGSIRGAPALASHQTAARIYGVPVFTDAAQPTLVREHVTIPRAHRRPQPDPVCIHVQRVEAADVVHRDGVAMTRPVRTIADLLLDADRPVAIWAAERAVSARLVTPADVAARLHECRHVPGVIEARRRLDLVEPRSESPLETLTRLVLIDRGLPAPAAQIPVADPASGQVWFRIDLGYEADRLGIECDGVGVHGAPSALFADRRRQNLLNLLGWTILRVTWADVTQRPSYVSWLVRRALADAA